MNDNYIIISNNMIFYIAIDSRSYLEYLLMEIKYNMDNKQPDQSIVPCTEASICHQIIL
jgi:hypothetical protein